MKLIVLGNRVLIKAHLPDTKIAIDPRSELEPSGYEVIGLGDGDKINPQLKVGVMVKVPPVRCYVDVGDNRRIYSCEDILAIEEGSISLAKAIA